MSSTQQCRAPSLHTAPRSGHSGTHTAQPWGQDSGLASPEPGSGTPQTLPCASNSRFPHPSVHPPGPPGPPGPAQESSTKPRPPKNFLYRETRFAQEAPGWKCSRWPEAASASRRRQSLLTFPDPSRKVSLLQLPQSRLQQPSAHPVKKVRWGAGRGGREVSSCPSRAGKPPLRSVPRPCKELLLHLYAPRASPNLLPGRTWS